MFEAKSDLSRLVRLLETKEEDIIYLARNGKRIAQLTLIPQTQVNKRIGAGKGIITLPDEFDDIFDSLDKDVEKLFLDGDNE